MELRAVSTDAAPPAIGPYAQAIEAGGFVFTSGQIGLDPSTGELVPGGIQAETERVLDNLEAVLAAAGTSFRRAVKVTIYLADMEDFATVNALYARRLGDPPPARATVQVARLPRGALVEMDVVALAAP